MVHRKVRNGWRSGNAGGPFCPQGEEKVSRFQGKSFHKSYSQTELKTERPREYLPLSRLNNLAKSGGDEEQVCQLELGRKRHLPHTHIHTTKTDRGGERTLGKR